MAANARLKACSTLARTTAVTFLSTEIDALDVIDLPAQEPGRETFEFIG